MMFRPTMKPSLLQLRARTGLAPAIATAIAPVAAGCLLLASGSAAASSSSAAIAHAFGASLATATVPQQSGAVDQVFVQRRGSVRPFSGKLVKNGLEAVVLEIEGEEREFPAVDIVRVSVGILPNSYLEGRSMAKAGDLDNAVRAFQLAADDSEASEAARAQAHLEASRALIAQAGRNGGDFSTAITSAEEFLTAFADHRETPAARALLGRAQVLSGDSATGAATYAALFGELQDGTPTTGYGLVDCLQAGLEAARAYARAGDADAARSTYDQLGEELPRANGALEPNDPRQSQLRRLTSLAELGEGWAFLAEDKSTQAKNFFNNKLENAERGDFLLRAGARVGLGEALLSSGNADKAQFEFARASALVSGDRDLAARALLGLANALVEVGAPKDVMLPVLTSLTQTYGDTPAARAGRELADR